jgi:hypothetical protein
MRHVDQGFCGSSWYATVHDSVGESNAIDRFREAAIVDQRRQLALTQLARQLRIEVLDEFKIERHIDAGRHRKSLGSIESRGYHCALGQASFEADIDQPYLIAAEQIGGDQSRRLLTGQDFFATCSDRSWQIHFSTPIAEV